MYNRALCVAELLLADAYEKGKVNLPRQRAVNELDLTQNIYIRTNNLSIQGQLYIFRGFQLWMRSFRDLPVSNGFCKKRGKHYSMVLA